MPFTSALVRECLAERALSPVRPPDSCTSASSRCRRVRSAAVSPSAVVVGNRRDVRDAVGLARLLARDAMLRQRAERDVVLAVRQFLDFVDHARRSRPGTPTASARNPSRTRPEQHHPDDAIAFQRIRHHRLVARFEDVQRHRHVREEHHVFERKNRDRFGQRASVPRPRRGWRTGPE